MATEEEIKVGSIVCGGHGLAAGIVLACPSKSAVWAGDAGAADIYWFEDKSIYWEYIDCLKVLVR